MTEKAISDSDGPDATDAPPSGRLRDLIRADIVDGVYEPGARLKTAELAGRYQMSAIPIREALHQLEGEGFVVLSPNRSAVVRTVDEPLLRNIFEVRLLLEAAFTRWFVTHHTPAELNHLVATQERYDIAVGENDIERCQELNRAFHATCYERHYNSEALAIYSKYTNLLRALFRRFPNSPVRARSAGREHWQIIEAIRAHDEARAVEVVEDHTRATCQYMIECIYSERKTHSPLHAAE